MKKWTGEFGRQYTKRNLLPLDQMEELYRRNYGITRTELNELFLGRMPSSTAILEVGSNVGNQLLCLQKMGFDNLFGIEPQSCAVGLSKSRTNDVDIVQGTVFDMPYKDRCFDLVFTSGLLIHISPSDIAKAMKEIHRCAREYIWGFEYHADQYAEVIYRGERNLLWKAGFPKLYLQHFPDLELVREKRLKYLDSDNTDSMFLLRKKSPYAIQRC